MPTILGQSISKRVSRLVQRSSSAEAETTALASKVESGSTAEWVRRATAEAIDRHQCDHYTRRPGLAELCRQVADQLAKRGVEVDPAGGVIITGSVQEARFVTLRSLAAGKTVLVPQPAPEAYYAGLDFAGSTLLEIDPDGAPPATPGAILIVPSPQLTAARPMQQDWLDRLAALAARHDGTIVADETVATPRSTIPPGQSPAEFPGLASRTVIIGSFATPGLEAWQVSWVAGPTSLVTRVRDMKQAMTICTPAASQYAALASFIGSAGMPDAGRNKR